jgi:hypothetical protein
MSKVLKLTGLATYTSAAVNHELVKKGQKVRFSDTMAERVMKKGRYNADNEFTPYFAEQPVGTPFDMDFSKEPVKAIEDEDVIVPVKAAVKKPVQRKMKAPAAGAAAA